MLSTILLVVAGLIVLFLIVAAFQSPVFRIVREGTIATPPAIPFGQINDFHNWDNWSPWAKLDPAMKVTYSGAPAGKGAEYHWSGNNKAGEGHMTIVESEPDRLLRMRLEFIRPFANTNAVEFIFTSENGGTRVTWTMSGQKNFMSKAFGLIMSMDKLVGRDFEKGLAQLKAVSEAQRTTV